MRISYGRARIEAHQSSAGGLDSRSNARRPCSDTCAVRAAASERRSCGIGTRNACHERTRPSARCNRARLSALTFLLQLNSRTAITRASGPCQTEGGSGCARCPSTFRMISAGAAAPLAPLQPAAAGTGAKWPPASPLPLRGENSRKVPTIPSPNHRDTVPVSHGIWTTKLFGQFGDGDSRRPVRARVVHRPLRHELMPVRLTRPIDSNIREAAEALRRTSSW